MKSNDKMGRCNNCKHLDRKQSNINWLICPIIPFDVIVDRTSENCEKYVGIRGQNSSRDTKPALNDKKKESKE